MASSSSIVSEEHLLCCICLDVFTEPVSTPCGHNFCKKCLGGYWDTSNHWHCPLCNKSYEKRLDLSVNTFISETAAHFRKSVQLKAGSTAENNPSKSTEVLCDVCSGDKEKSVKFCLNCGASYCETHLEPHKKIQLLKKHKLMDPVENLEDYMCLKHDRPLELFCRDDQTSVCMLCAVTDHKTHSTVPLEEAGFEFKAQLEKTQTQVQKMIQDRLEKTEEIKHALELSKKSTGDETAGGVEVFTALMRSIERSQAELLEVMEEEQKAAEREAEGFIKELEQEIAELKRRDTELEKLSHTEDPLHLLQAYPSLCSPPHTNNWADISLTTQSNKGILMTSLSRLQKSLNKEMDKEIQKWKPKHQRISAVHNWVKMKWTLLLLLLPLLLLVILIPRMMCIQFYAVDVTLDPDTAHQNLILSADGKQVRLEDIKHNLPDNPKRFSNAHCVLGKEGYSGRFYFEVQVSGKTGWILGVARESINRKGIFMLNPQDGYWTVWMRNENELIACDSHRVAIPLKVKPQRVGVFVDYEEGLVSFYNVEDMSLIYSFIGHSFSEKLYPFLRPGFDHGGLNSAPLIISDRYLGLTKLIFSHLALLLR